MAFECSLADSFVPNLDVIRNMLRKATQDNIAPDARALFQPFTAFLSAEDGELVRSVSPHSHLVFTPSRSALSKSTALLVLAPHLLLYRASIGSANRLGSYIVLLDPQGRIRWKASGQPSPIDMELCVSAVLDLVKEAQQQGTPSRSPPEAQAS